MLLARSQIVSGVSRAADVNLTVVMGAASLAEELHHHVRIPQAILVNALVAAVANLRPRAAKTARAKAIEAVSDLLLEP